MRSVGIMRYLLTDGSSDLAEKTHATGRVSARRKPDPTAGQLPRHEGNPRPPGDVLRSDIVVAEARL
jgi:hypothetical protein